MGAESDSGLMSHVGGLLARRQWSREQLLAYQRRALGELVRHAVGESPYYREAFGGGLGKGDVTLEELPTLSKATLMDEWDRVITDRRLRLRDVEGRLAGGAVAGPYLGEYRICETGGSTGSRGIFVYGRAEFETVMAGMLRALALLGIGGETRLASIGSPSPLHLSNHVFAAFRAGRTGSPSLMVTMPLNELVDALNDYEPEVIATYPTLIALLADEQLEGRLRVQPRLLLTSSEVLSEDIRSRARQSWGIEMNDAYISTEGAMMAVECPEHCGRHIWEDHVILEVVDERNRAVPAGVPGSKVLLTNLWNRTQPLIRYELADSVTLSTGANPTGMPFARIGAVDGRGADILRLPAAGGGRVAVHPFSLREPFSRLPKVRQFQLHYDDEGLRVEVVLAPAAPRETLVAVHDELVQTLRAAGALPPPIEVEPVEEIARVGSGAKLTLVRSSRPSAEPALVR